MKDVVINNRKVAIVGCGFVGSATAFCLMQSGLFSEMVLIDADHDKAEGEALDIAHGIPFIGHVDIYAGGYDDIVDAAIVIITAGANQKPDETRLDLVHKNVGIYKSIIPEIYGKIAVDDKGNLETTGAKRTGCSMCGFGIHKEGRPHRFDKLRERNPKEWEFYMYRCCTDPDTGEKYGWGKVLDYIGVEWEDVPGVQVGLAECFPRAMRYTG